MSEELNLQSPYNYSAGDLNTYRFETVSGVGYIAYFIEIPGFQSSRVYSFSFERISERRGHDLRVAITISKIIIDFFTRNDDALIFTCDNHDRKHQYRNILKDGLIGTLKGILSNTINMRGIFTPRLFLINTIRLTEKY